MRSLPSLERGQETDADVTSLHAYFERGGVDAAAVNAVAPSVSPAGLWELIRGEARAHRDPVLRDLTRPSILDQPDFAAALAYLLSRKLSNDLVRKATLFALIRDFQISHPLSVDMAVADLASLRERDPAASGLLVPFLFFKGFHAIQSYRVSHWLWHENRRPLAHYIQGRASEVFAVDIHPAARLGQRIMFDHGTGIVVGETAVIEDDAALLQNVTLGGTGKEAGDRHPKVRRGALIGTGAKVLGNIEIGEGAKVGAGSIVLKPVAPFTTVVGNPARVVGAPHRGLPSLTMDQSLPPIEYAI
ncbi:serine O-acetyltransferase [Gluconacetobacter liquefaciens]|uniref:Serine acetyltransferase n=1 Tax=Gluconacetobacter liquefaciens TaxID=89584 RepID=A0A370G3A3_GLULI|nr:serine O-acetyltransferase [Gluconacetobacter liquefaciens]MBB2186671.1 serine O-acetyltransferase [Gluconacetobacter liquefaciens]RDI38341.1 serine O-acetyltransferase [Gluconacetobacter liquefaciens]GBQ93486.1 serine O-acetyltransferase [Gluconacetobacter liquefaciens NRIC 0522]GEB36600.1 serine O-acetyltransferase [Gluconacetobacter liquefaciens]